MLLGGVAGYQIKQDVHAAPVRLFKAAHKIVVRAVAGRDLFVIAHVVARVLERGIEARVDPDGVAAEAFDVV